ncbi:hypothetical protein [Vallitalea guaymasensis]|uniref:hypothetical protein n=1 Tax=Vallitalea guaymasensis TaxID=1185412 RepID=UPI000DE3E009|nr:hypothetical protein [Vallitalea guaymasensis]
MEKNKIEIIRKLEELNEDPNAIKPFMMKYLEAIEQVFQDFEIEYEAAIRTLGLNKLKIKNIASKLGISRTTMYNHDQLIKQYIDISTTLFHKSNPLYKNESYKQQIIMLKNELDLMYERDVITEIQRQEIQTLAIKLNKKNKTVERLEQRNIELAKQLHDLKIENKRHTSKVSVLHKLEE